jgi:hypothetical protein
MKFEYCCLQVDTWYELKKGSTTEGEWFWRAYVVYDDVNNTKWFERKTPSKSTNFNPVKILDELGRSGWELVSTELRTAAFQIQHGGNTPYYEAQPVERKFWLKRRID